MAQTVRVFHAQSGTLTSEFSMSKYGYTFSVGFTKDGRHIVSAFQSGEVKARKIPLEEPALR